MNIVGKHEKVIDITEKKMIAFFKTEVDQKQVRLGFHGGYSFRPEWDL